MLRKLFAKILNREETDDVVTFAKAIESLIDEISLDIFREYKATLLAEPNTYIVPAVWGAMKEKELTGEQKDIHARIAPAIREILDLLLHESQTAPQKFALGYLVRGLFISKIIYMVEFYKNLSAKHGNTDEKGHDLKDIEPLGHA